MNVSKWRRIGGAGAVMLLAVGLSLGGSVPANAAAASTYTNIKLARTTPYETTAGAKVSFSGKAPVGLVSKTVTLQRRVAGQSKWVNVGSGKVAKNQTFTASGMASGLAKNYWRVVNIVGSKTQQSGEISTAVFSWYYLSDLKSVGTTWNKGAVEIGGKYFTNSISRMLYNPGQSARIEYNSSYKCKEFVAAVGLEGRSGSESRIDFSMSADGVTTKLASNVGVGSSKIVKVPIRGKYRIAIDIVKTAGKYNDGYAALGNAKLLCSGQP